MTPKCAQIEPNDFMVIFDVNGYLRYVQILMNIICDPWEPTEALDIWGRPWIRINIICLAGHPRRRDLFKRNFVFVHRLIKTHRQTDDREGGAPGVLSLSPLSLSMYVRLSV